MPTINMPLVPYDKFKELKRKTAKEKLARRVELYREQERIKIELKTLNAELYGVLRSALPEELKSVEFDRCQVTALDGSPRKTFDAKKMRETLFECPNCEHDITVPAKVIESAYKYGKTPDPTVSVTSLDKKKKHANVDDGDEEGD